MTLAEFRKLKHRDFQNGAVIDEIEKVIEQREALLKACELIETIHDDAQGEVRMLFNTSLRRAYRDRLDSNLAKVRAAIAKAVQP